MSAYHIILRPFEQDVSVHHADSSCIDLITECDAPSSFPITWNTGETVSLTAWGCEGEDIRLHISGLVSDNSLVFISGDFGMEIMCSSAELEQFYNLHTPDSGSIVDISSASSTLTLRIFMNGYQMADICDDSHMTVTKNMRSNGSSLNISTNSITLTAVVLAMVSDWSDGLMGDLADIRMQDMIYTEVG